MAGVALARPKRIIVMVEELIVYYSARINY